MTGKVISLADRRPTGRYYELRRYLYDVYGYVSPREVCKVLFGVSLISAAPFFYLLVTHDVMPCVVFMANAAAGAVVGVRNFARSHRGRPGRAPARNVPRVPGVARRGLKAA